MRSSADIITHIATIYDELDILPSIREHQARVAGVILVIKVHWRGPTVNWDDAVAAALLHDLGNLVKANLDSPIGQAIIGPVECERIEHWREAKRQLIAAYGGDEGVTTQALAQRANAPERVRSMMNHSRFTYNNETLVSEDIELLLLTCADQRVGPFGVLPHAQRIEEARKRYGYTGRSADDIQVRASYGIAARVQQFVTIPLDSITEENVREHVQRFLRRD